MDLRFLGRAAWRLSRRQSWLEVTSSPCRYRRASGRAGARDIDDFRSGRGRMGIFPSDGLHDRGQHHFGHGGTQRRRSPFAMATCHGWRGRLAGKSWRAVRENGLL